MPTAPTLNWQTLGIEVKWRRKKLGLSQAELARRADVVPNSISRLENGYSGRIETVAAVARVLDWALVEAACVLAGVSPPEAVEEPAPLPEMRDFPNGKGFYFAPSDPERIDNALLVTRVNADKGWGSHVTEDDLRLIGDAISALGDQLFHKLAERRAEDQPTLDEFVSTFAQRAGRQNPFVREQQRRREEG